MSMPLPFPVGTISNPLPFVVRSFVPHYQSVQILYPSRLNAMALDPSKINPSETRLYSAGEIVFAVQLHTKISVSVTSTGVCEIDDLSQRKSLIQHAFLLMKHALGFKNGLFICVENQYEVRHAGLGSSGCLIAGVAAAINELYGNPIAKEMLISYLAQNHGEEIENDDAYLIPVQCLGGSAAAGIHGGGLLLLAGPSRVIKTMTLPHDYTVVIGIPHDFVAPDSREALRKELEHMEGFISCGQTYGPVIAYRLLHECLPAMNDHLLGPLGDLIYDYRFTMGSIKNCSFLYPKIIDIMNNLSFLKEKGIVDVLSLSSVGPGVFAITKNPDACLDAFRQQHLTTYVTTIENNGYQTIHRQEFGSSFWNEEKWVASFAHKKVSPYVEQMLSRLPQGKALDMGCGGGRHSELLARLGFDTFVVDAHLGMLHLTRERLRKIYADVEKRTFTCSMLNLCFEDSTFDVLVATGVFHQAKSLQEYAASLSEASRVLKKGGFLISEIFTSDVFDPSSLRLDDHTFLTKEGLLMTLLSVEEYTHLAHQTGLQQKDSSVLERKHLETGERSVLRMTFIKT